MRAAIAFAVALVLCGTALAADGRLDPTFGLKGEVTIDLGGAERAQALLLQPDGKPFGAPWRSARALPSWSGGTATAPSTRRSTGRAADARRDRRRPGSGARPEPDGKLLVAWQTLTTTGETVMYHVRLLRLNADGTPDTSFASGGTAEIFTGGAAGLQGGGPAGAQGIAVLPDGRIVVLLATQIYGLRPDGSAEWNSALTFPGLTAEGHKVAAAPGGRILVAGAIGDAGTSNAIVEAFLTGGSFDTTFGPPVGGGLGKGTAVGLAVLPDGRLAVATRTAVFRLSANGATEATAPVAGQVTALAVDAQQRIVVATATGLTRFTTALKPDPTFGAGGTAGLAIAQPTALAVQPDGKLVVAATQAGDAAVLRLPAMDPCACPASR